MEGFVSASGLKDYKGVYLKGSIEGFIDGFLRARKAPRTYAQTQAVNPKNLHQAPKSETIIVERFAFGALA